jgi:large subunit ribosomal protein LX
LGEVKTFIISGEIKKRLTKIPFIKEVKSTKKENAIEKLYTELGSRHKAKRFEIKIKSLEEKKNN